MIIERSQYNFEESLIRIDQMLNTIINEKDVFASVPIINDLPIKGGVVTNISVMQVEMKMLPSCSSAQQLKIYRAFMSEAIAIMSSHSHCEDVLTLGTRLTAVFNTPLKKDIESLIDKAAMINTLAYVVSRKAQSMGGGSISVIIGMDYGEVILMRFGKYSASELQPSGLAWMGEPINKTIEMIDERLESNRNIWISGVIFRNLSDEYKRFFRQELPEDHDYGANIINTYMKSWLNKQ